MTIKRGGEIHRLKIIKGHLKKVIDMVEQEDDCMSTMQQLEAVISSLKKTQQLLLEQYVRKCLMRTLNDTQEGKRINKELIALFISH